MSESKICRFCGKELASNSSFCASCGKAITVGETQKNKKDVDIATVASFFVTGLGQIYCGEVLRGVLMLVSFIILGLVLGTLFGWLGVTLSVLLWIANIYDAHKLAEKVNKDSVH